MSGGEEQTYELDPSPGDDRLAAGAAGPPRPTDVAPQDLFDEGGVITAGLPVAPPDQGAEDAVRTYLRSIGRVPLLTREDEVRLAKRIEQNDMAAKNALIG